MRLFHIWNIKIWFKMSKLAEKIESIATEKPTRRSPMIIRFMHMPHIVFVYAN